MKNLGLRTLVATGLVGVLTLLWLLLRLPPEARPESPSPSSTPEHADPTAERPPGSDIARSAVLETEGPAIEDPVSPPVDDVETGTLHLLSASTLAAAIHSEWTLLADLDEVERTADDHGALLVPAGTWRLRSVDAEWVAPPEPVVVEPNSEQVIWVEPRTSRRFRAVTQTGTPIEGATVAWRSRTSGDSRPIDGADDLVLRETDAMGRAVLDGGSFSNGSVTFLRQGYSRLKLSLCGPPTDEEIEVRMLPSSGGRSLRFVLDGEETTLSDLVVKSIDGIELSRSTKEPDVVHLPGWIPVNETIRVTSPLSYPSQFRLNDLAGDTVVLPGRVSVPVLVDDLTGCDSDLSIAVRPTESLAPREVEPILVGQSIDSRSGEELRFDLPGGHAVRVQATNECGSAASLDLLVGRAHSAVRLLLQVSVPLEIRVRDGAGATLPTASARVLGLGTFRADASGVVRVPVTPMTQSIHVSAPDHSSVIVSRPAALSTADVRAESLEVVLSRSSRLVVRVVSPEGRALAGMRVRVWPDRASNPAQDGTRWAVGRVSASIAGTTDGEGRCALTGLEAGALRIEVDLPTVVGTDPWKRCAYPPYRFERRSLDDAEVTLTVPEPVQLRLRVTDGSTGAPVAAFTLIGQAPTVPPVEVTGGYWQGWISSAVTTFQATVQGLGSTTFTIDPNAGDVERSIRVGPQSTGTLRITDLPGTVSGTRIAVQFMQESAQGLHLVASTEAILDDHGEAPVDLGVLDAAWVAIAPIERGGQRWTFSPEVQAIRSGQALEFRAAPSGE